MQALIYICFLLSGATGLVYEVIWGRYFQLFIGSTTYAHAVVLGAFMGGLALGNFLFGRVADRRYRKLALYGWLELGIGTTCILFPMFFNVLERLYFAVASTNPESGGNQLLKLVLSAIAILPPTVLMGGTLPVLSKFVIERMQEVGSKVGRLYFLNSVGAMAGTLLAGFYLVATFGLGASMMLTGAVNITIGLLFLVLKAREALPATTDGARTAPAPAPDNDLLYSRLQARWTLVLIGLSGFLTMLYELVWIRLLALVMGGSTYSFSIMLFSFIGGISIGGMIVSMLMRKERDAIRLLAVCEMGVFASLLLMIPAYERLPYIYNLLESMLSRTEATFALYQGLKTLIASGVMAIPTILIGMTLPLATKVAVRGLQTLGRGVGTAFSINTVGNLLGATLGGLLIIPALGLQWTIELAILGSGLIGAAFWCLGTTARPMVRFGPLAATLALFLIFSAVSGRWDHQVLNAGGYRVRNRVADSYQEYVNTINQWEMLYHEDGPTCSVIVRRRVTGTKELSLKVNGKSDAGTGEDMRTQLFLGHLPLLLHQNPERALVIGLGSGITASAVLKHPVKSCDVVEISPAVVKASAFFDEISGAPLNDPRCHLFVADARDHLQLQPEASYDVIISEPSNPWIAGIGNLFTVEYFQSAARRLAKGGLMLQWLHLYEMDDEILAVALNSFGAAFPQVTVWNPWGLDILLLGSMEPLKPDLELIAQRLADPVVAASMNPTFLTPRTNSLVSFLSLQMMGSERFRTFYPGEGRVNRDHYPVLEYEAPRAFFLGKMVTGLFLRDERHRPRTGNGLYIADYLGNLEVTTAEIEELAAYFGHLTNASDARILQALAWHYVHRDGGSPDAIDLYLRVANKSLAGEEILWSEKASGGKFTPADWERYRQFAARTLKQAVSVFTQPDFALYDKIHRRCLELFPERADELNEERMKLRERLMHLSSDSRS